MDENKRIIKALIGVSFLFVAMVSYLLYINLFRAPEWRQRAMAEQMWSDENFIRRGKIYDSEGVVLAQSVERNVMRTDSDGNESEVKELVREYPKGNLFSHVVGYCAKSYDKSQLENTFNDILIPKDNKGDIIRIGEAPGDDLHLTINAEFQEYVYKQMNKNAGAVVALEPQTGKVLAMVSLPDFSPEEVGYVIEKNMNEEKNKGELLNRATQATYPPGSTFKIITAAAAYENGMKDKIFNDQGGYRRDGEIAIKNAGGKKYGKIGLERAFEVSSNQVFAEIADELGTEKLREITGRFGLDHDILFDLPLKQSTVGYKNGTMFQPDCANVGIGQGQVEVSPLQMAMVCATIANDGRLMQPYIVESIRNEGTLKTLIKAKEIRQVIDSDCADFIEDMMVGVVKNGTGTLAQISGVTVAGKTGTAENGQANKDHAWFVGYAPVENPKIAVAVMLEYNGNGGGTVAAPIAGKIMKEYLKKYSGK